MGFRYDALFRTDMQDARVEKARAARLERLAAAAPSRPIQAPPPDPDPDEIRKLLEARFGAAPPSDEP